MHLRLTRSARTAGTDYVPADEPEARNRRRFAALVLLVGITALAFNLRPTITSLPPVFPELAARLGLSSAAVTTLATIPVVCFGVFSGFATRLSRQVGDEQALFAALAVLTVSLALRGAFPGVALFPATILAAGAIAIMNVLLVGKVKRRMPARAGLVGGPGVPGGGPVGSAASPGTGCTGTSWPGRLPHSWDCKA